MNIFSGLAAAGTFVKKNVVKAAKAVGKVARQEFSGELQRVKDSATEVRTAVSDSVNRARDAAADAIAKGAAGAGARVAARVGSEGNVYQRALSFVDSPEKKMWAVAGLVLLVVLVLVMRKGGRV